MKNVKKLKKEPIAWGIVIIAFALGGIAGLLFERERVNGRIEATVAVVRQQLDAAKLRMWQHGIVDDSMMKEAQNIMMMTQADPTSVKVALSGNKTSGSALVLRKQNMLYVTVQAKLAEPVSGSFYEAWLQKTGNSPVKLGRLIKLTDGSWGLAYSSSNLYAGYNKVVVTLEKLDDQKPEVPVLEGLVK